jgi:hypothetical protein
MDRGMRWLLGDGSLRSWGVRGGVLVATVLVAWLASERVGGASTRPLRWQSLAGAVGPVEFGGPEEHRFRSARDFANFLRHVETGSHFRIPRVDFGSREVVIFAVGPRSSSSDSLTVQGVVTDGTRIVLTVDERTPSLHDRGRPQLTFPFVMVVLPRSADPVSVDWRQEP